MTKAERQLLAEIARLEKVRERSAPEMLRFIDDRIAELKQANEIAHQLEKCK